MTLSPQQKRELKKLAHHLKPVVMVGQHGLRESVQDEIDIALDSHELIKVKLAGADKADREQLSGAIASRQNADLVQIIGRVAIFYRPNPDKKKNRIVV
ncbi:MAG: ribosome assembly RNA-binding protein YhbY [gamma proteobacterium endosymbiont of Lamellibrachia anaximandri]|nr:ribosome assembly RNA-binding protein YhbY [gamma proteobacterium endosymbiont of Lamellibrachia anaximandri]MBL3533328.1 ribosome assembly RNA-binding protein YhbY [gamma proteobacterium endosymbiont of Lamellibrachia anaximandri]MBL3599183.1 ribosome assembly RNA-binding protein YhbY [gamma proteobacterium endosymbiont of Lamellibrachia anaximandri]